MSIDLVLPIAGESSRYPDTRPKWLLTHPSGNLMLTESIRGLNPGQFNKIIIIGLEKHEDKYGYSESLYEELQENYNFPVEDIDLILLKKETTSESETIYKGLSRAGKQSGPMLVKDSDNYFEMRWSDLSDRNLVAIASLYDFDSIDPGNKSYIAFGENETVVNIAEKEIISPWFCVGAYGFNKTEHFLEYFEKISQKNIKGELYVSHIIYKMLQEGKLFFGTKVDRYTDWGTLEDWKSYRQNHVTLFVDIDGVLVKNSSKHFDPKWGETGGISPNIEALQDIFETGKSYILLTTSRTEEYREKTKAQLNDLNIPYNQLIMGLPHSKRVLINDYSNTNGYPSALSINLSRDKENLKEKLASLIDH